MGEFPDYYYNQSAVIPIRGRGDDLRVLLISSRTNKRWVIPKGIIEPALSPEESAAKEAHEEAGIEGHVFPYRIGDFEYDKWGGTCKVQVFVMDVEKVHDHWLENFRERVWVTLEEATQRMREKALQTILQQVPVFLTRTSKP